MKKLHYIILTLAFLGPSVSTLAKHIVGGEITYQFISRNGSTNRYRFTMKIYRDCNSVGGAPYDQIAPISIYRKSTNRLADNFGVPLGPVQRVSMPSLPCLIPPNVCVEEGLYVWERDLPIIDDSYVVIYQRCCRNETIENIIRPGDVGATYSVEITGLAQRTNNNSPTFKSFPPIVICAGEKLNFDHSATDAEGDQLVYRFCQPLAGGGKFGGTTCESTTPNPACWPIGAVSFIAPNYSFDRPLGGDPVVQINPSTGRITGTPMVQGQFVLAVCLEEYRGGQLLSVVQRDFQFNVAKCDPTVRGKIVADTVLPNRTYLIRSCGDKVVAVKNQSVERSNINDIRYEINIAGQTRRFTDWEPTVSFPDTGVYNGQLLLNPGTQCADTINLMFRIFPAAIASFAMAYDTCVAGPVRFTNQSSSGSGGISKWQWDFGDGNASSTPSPTYQYQTPGLKPVRLSVEDVRGCKDDSVRILSWYPVPPTLIIEPNTFDGCTPARIAFNNLSKPIDSTYDIRWNFGDGNSSRAISPTHLYTTPGTYSVSIDLTSPIGCKASRTFNNWIRVRPGSKADFSFAPERITIFNNTVTFTDKSSNASRWQWFFNNRGFSQVQNPNYTFRDTGVQTVRLVVSNQFNCFDTLSRTIDVEPQITFWLPNAFSPNDDGNNDEYKGVGFLYGMRDYTMQVWNRWGELIFQSKNPEEGWNGRKFNKGDQAPQGVYLCVVNLVTPRGVTQEVRSYATLIR